MSSRHPNAKPDGFGAHITKNQKATIKVYISFYKELVLYFDSYYAKEKKLS
jgi:hypothetical protein